MTTDQPLVTTLINNYNYGRFLRRAIDSALDQTYGNTETVVVDDGSTDESLRIIAKYGDRVSEVLKENGGQPSAFNAGVAKSRGDILCFLDSDDYFAPNKVEEVVRCFQRHRNQGSNFLVYHLLEVVDESGVGLGDLIPERVFDCPPNLYRFASKYRFIPYIAAPTSGLAVTRSLANRIFPLPTDAKISADDFVVRAAALIGNIYGMDKALGAYRVHRANRWFHRRPVKSIPIVRAMDDFLNQKLHENNLVPVLSFFDSMDSRIFSRTRRDDIRLAFSVVGHRCDLTTLKFMVKTLIECFTRDYLPDEQAPSNA
jgi:glycosyltransferase involved in cell wall biosynthesis